MQSGGEGRDRPEHSLAVLPFANLSADADNCYFADGLTDEVITTLSKVGTLRVISRTTMMQLRDRTQSLGEVARQLGVTHVLEGSVRKAGDRLRISASLVGERPDREDLLARALEYAERIEPHEPASPFSAEIRGLVAALHGDVAEAARQLGGAFEQLPEDLDVATWYALQLAYTGRSAAAIAITRAIIRTAPDHPLAWGHRNRRPDAHWPARRGRGARIDGAGECARRSARRVLLPEVAEGIWKDVQYAEYVAQGFALLGELEESARWLEQSVRLGLSIHDTITLHSAVWRPWLEHPRFVPVFQLLRQNAERYAKLPVAPRALAMVS